MPERLKVTPIEASVILLNEIFGRVPHDPKIAVALHGYGWRHNHYGRPNYSEEESAQPETFSSDPLKSRLLLDSVTRALDTLTPRERAFLETRMGIKTGQIPTLKEVGQEFSLISGEQPRQLVFKALRKLRHPSRSKELKQFLPENQT